MSPAGGGGGVGGNTCQRPDHVVPGTSIQKGLRMGKVVQHECLCSFSSSHAGMVPNELMRQGWSLPVRTSEGKKGNGVETNVHGHLHASKK